MPDLKTSHLVAHTVKRQTLLWAFPRISELPTPEWDSALERAKLTPFDGVERIAMVISVGFVAALLSFTAEQMESLGFFERYLIQLAFAFPLLSALLAPFYLRRLRRGLDIVILNKTTKPEREFSHDP